MKQLNRKACFKSWISIMVLEDTSDYQTKRHDIKILGYYRSSICSLTLHLRIRSWMQARPKIERRIWRKLLLWLINHPVIVVECCHLRHVELDIHNTCVECYWEYCDFDTNCHPVINSNRDISFGSVIEYLCSEIHSFSVEFFYQNSRPTWSL